MTLDRPLLADAFLGEARNHFSGRRVIVTGATGFIGRRLVAGLLLVGASVTVALRSRHGANQFEAAGAEVLVGQLQDHAFMSKALNNQQILFHLAYDVRSGGRENLHVFKDLCEVVQASELERIVHMSSLVVYDHWPGGKIDAEAAITRTGLEDYRDAKIAMEEALLAGAKPAAILQPGIVHGPGSALWTTAPREALKRGPVILPDPIGLCPAVHVDDVVQAALRAAMVNDLGHERFVLCGRDQLDWRAFYQSHIDALGQGAVELQAVERLKARLPVPAAHGGGSQSPSAAARISQSLRQVIGRERFEKWTGMVRNLFQSSGPVYPDHNMLILMSARGDISDAQTRARIGYDPQHGV